MARTHDAWIGLSSLASAEAHEFSQSRDGQNPDGPDVLPSTPIFQFHWSYNSAGAGDSTRSHRRDTQGPVRQPCTMQSVGPYIVVHIIVRVHL